MKLIEKGLGLASTGIVGTLLLVSSLALSASAQDRFGPEKLVAGRAVGPMSLFAADLDGDGDQDVLSASSGDDKIAWYENVGGPGTAMPQRVISALTDGPRSVYAADLDGDGDPDVLSASWYDDKIAWYENVDGRGVFGHQRVIDDTVWGADSVLAADLDGDGDEDVLAASFHDDEVVWYENLDGQGSFGAKQVITATADAVTSIFAADLDGDGDQDVLSAAEYADEIAWYKNAGQGDFGPPVIITTLIDSPRCVFAADLDGDGDQDVLSASAWDDKLAWYENTNGSGSFGPEIPIATMFDYALWVLATDLDGDGDRDVLAASYYSDKIARYENTDGQGSFGSQRVVTALAAGATSVLAADLDDDGDQDVLSTSGEDWEIESFENTDGLGSFGPPTAFTAKADRASCVFAADLDGDGDKDALSASRFDYKIAWYEYLQEEGTFGPQRIITDQAHYPLSVFAADLDGDGDRDALSSSSLDDTIAWYENTNGLGDFGPPLIVTTEAIHVFDAIAVDIDGDGDQDVASAEAGHSRVRWYENTDGLGTFGPPVIVTAMATGVRNVFAVDLDGDGDQDLLYANYDNDEIAWSPNFDGNGFFWPKQVISSSVIGAHDVYAADLDGDDDLDVISAADLGDEVAWYENTDGLGTFGPGIRISGLTDRALSVFAGDVDGDGDQDVLSGSALDRKVAWYENTDGLGTFGPQKLITTMADGVRSVFAADVEGDGDLDVFSASQNDDQVAWYENGPPASVTYRDAGGNPASYFHDTRPVLGTTYSATVDLGGTTGHAMAGLAGYSTPLSLTLGGGQVLLVDITDPDGELLGLFLVAGPLAAFDVPVPNDLALAGFTLSTQALHVGGVQPFALSNALDLVVGDD